MNASYPTIACKVVKLSCGYLFAVVKCRFTERHAQVLDPSHSHHYVTLRYGPSPTYISRETFISTAHNILEVQTAHLQLWIEGSKEA